MAELPPLAGGPLPMGPPIVLPPSLSPAETAVFARDLRSRWEGAGQRVQALGGELADGHLGDALRDVFVPGFLSGHHDFDTVLPETRPHPGTDGVALGRMAEPPGLGYVLDTRARTLSLFGQDEMGRPTTPALTLQADGAGETLRTPDGIPVGALRDDGSFELNRRDLAAMAQAVERDSPSYPRDAPRPAAVVSPQAASTPPDPDWDPEEVPRRDPTAADRLNNVMRGYRTQEYQVGRWTVRLDKEGMEHVMERHVPDTWNGSTASVRQTFFARGTTPADIQRMVGEVLQQHRGTLLDGMTRSDLTLVGRTAEGVDLQVTLAQGRVVQVYPMAPRPVLPPP